MTSFVGRRRELAEVKRLLETTRLLTLTGAGGCGKSRLAVRAGAELARAFPDGVCLVELASLGDTALLVHAVLQALDVRDQTSSWPLATLSDYLAKKRLLLVLDNCEHLRDGCAVLVDALLHACGDLRLLATSRQPLGVPGEATFRVPSLSLPGPGQSSTAANWRTCEAIALFEDRATAVDARFSLSPANVSAVAELCRRLDGIPLAIELAAVWVRTLGVTQILERLDDRFRLLSKGSPIADRRHRTLRAALDWSFERLSEPERVLWQRVSIFPGSFDLDGAVAVTAGEPVPAGALLDVLDELVAKSILNREPGDSTARYQLLETIREYGREGLRASGEERDLRRRHCDWVASLVAEADGLPGAHQARWLDLIQREQDNLRAALDFCLREPGHAASGLLMAARCWLHWLARGHLGEARRWLTSLLEVAPEPTAARARALATLAMVMLSGGDTRSADVVVEEGLQVARQVGDQRTAALCLLWSGVSGYMQSDFARAEPSLVQAVEEFASAGDETGLATSRIALGALTGLRGDLVEAEALLEQSRRLARELNDGWLVAQSTLSQGSLLARAGRAARASELLHEAIRAAQTLGDRWAVATAVDLLALVAGAEGRAERAAQLLGAAEALWETAPPAFTEEWVAGRERSRMDARARLGTRAFEATTAYGRTMSLDQAIRLALEEADPPRPAPLAPRASPQLSSRELEVAALVAEGLSNKQIAARLIIAERTVDTHVNHILTKLGFTSRVQLAAWHADTARSVPDT